MSGMPGYEVIAWRPLAGIRDDTTLSPDADLLLWDSCNGLHVASLGGPCLGWGEPSGTEWSIDLLANMGEIFSHYASIQGPCAGATAIGPATSDSPALCINCQLAFIVDAWALPPRPRLGSADSMAAAATAPTRAGIRAPHFVGYSPITPPSSLVIATIEGRGGMSARKSGQRVDGLSKVEPASSDAGCCTATNSVRLSGVKHGPHISAPVGVR